MDGTKLLQQKTIFLACKMPPYLKKSVKYILTNVFQTMKTHQSVFKD